MTPKELLGALRSGGETSRKRIYHSVLRDVQPGETPMPVSLIKQGADALKVDWRWIAAFCIVETQNVCLINGAPITRFEAHKWRKYRRGRREAIAFDKAKNPRNLSKRWAQYEKMAKADPKAAILSRSWGVVQIMGSNHEAAGHADLKSFLAAQSTLDGQMRSTVSWFKNNPRLLRAVQDEDLHMMSKQHNGSGYKRNKYDTKLKRAYHAAASL